MSIEVLVAAIGILGVVIGSIVSGGIQHIATARHHEWKYKIEMRTDAYKSLMDAASNLGIYTGALQRSGVTDLSQEHEKQLLIYRTQLAAAHSKMALYASQDVMGKAGKFFSKHAALNNDADFDAFIDMVEAMRADSYAACYSEFREHVDELMLRKALTA